MNKHVSIVEVGPRDGLQNEKQIICAKDKIMLVDMLSECGFDSIEVTSFVSPKWVPQLADATEVMDGIKRLADVRYTALTPNLKGYELAKATNADEVAIFAAASETFSHKNINCSIQQSIERFDELVTEAKRDNRPVRGYISCVVNCPYEGAIKPQAVVSVARALFELGCYEVSLGDTTGKGVPQTIAAMLDAVLEIEEPEKYAGHYHDTNHRALENIEVSLEKGIRRFDSVVAGLGGCPYAPGAKGNVSTSEVVRLLEKKGFHTGIDQEKLKKADEFVRGLVINNGGSQGDPGIKPGQV